MANLRVDKITSTETFETTGSVQFDGANDGLTISDNADFDLGTGDFTIEGWYYLVNAGTYVSLFDFRGSGADGVYPSLLRNNTGDYIYYYVDSASRITNVTINYNTWFHVTVCRSSGITRLFIDGKEKGSFQDSFDYVSRDILLGLSNSNSNDLRGNISNYRVVKGRALYTSNFKPPMRELEVVPGTIVLACQSKTDASLEKTGKTITVNGNAVASELTPGILTPVVKSGGGSAITGSVEFSGGTTSNPGDYLSVPNTTDLRLGSSDFTVEAYVNFTNGAVSNGVIVALWDNTNNQRSWNLYFDTSNGLYFAGSTNGSSGNNNVNASIDIEDGEWYHVAACRSGSTIKLFVNGVERASNTSVGTYYDNTTDLVTIGAQNHDNPVNYWKGFISNLRIVKGTALYTDNFIPPTRELKKVPGTVLLCCQDPDSPLTEATGKTITGYGSLNQSYGTDLVTNGQFTADSDWTKGDQWTISGNSASITDSPNRTSDSFLTQDGSSWIQAGQMYRVAVDWSITTGDFDVRIGGNANLAKYSINSTYSSPYYFDIEAGATNTLLEIIANQHMVGSINSIHVDYAPPSKAGSNFTPQVGDDRKVTFEGVTKINSDAYFYLPTGNTESREATGSYSAGTRGVFGGGTGPANLTSIEYVTIASTGNGLTFGDLSTAKRGYIGGVSSSTRGITGGGNPGSSPSGSTLIEYITIPSTGNARDFGDLTASGRNSACGSNSTRGIYAGGDNRLTTIDYVTISSKGNGAAFGSLTSPGRGNFSAVSNPTRVIFGGGYTTDTMEYVTIASTGNPQDFGDLTAERFDPIGISNLVRGIFAGGKDPSPSTFYNLIDYITMSSMGNAVDFGDLTASRQTCAGASSSTRGVFAGGLTPTPSHSDIIEHVNIMTTGNATSFGTLITGRSQAFSVSNGHGGLG